MKILVSFFSIWALIRSISYAMYEHKTNKNTVGAVCVVVLNIVTFVFINIMLVLN